MYSTGPITVSFPLGLFGSASMSMGSPVDPEITPAPAPVPEEDGSDVYWDEEGI